MPTRPPPHTPATGSIWVLWTLAIGFVMAMIDVTAVNVALPDIALNLSVPLTGLVWVVDGYTLTFAALLLAGGALADRFGPKTVYQGGLAVFLLGSVLCGLATSGTGLIAARLLQGAGAALFMPSSLSLLTHAYEDDRTRARILGIWSAMVGAASAVGPLVGGILVHSYGWRSVFWVNLPLGLLGIVLAQVLIAATPRQPRALSLLSHAFGVLILTALSFFLIEGPTLGWGSAPVVAAAVVAVAAALALVQRERTGAHPLLPRALLHTAGFGAANMTGFLINFAVFGQLFLLSLYLQQARSADALQAGLQLLPMMAAFTVGNLASGRISARVGTRKPMLVGLGVAALATVALVGVRLHTPYPVLLLGLIVVNLFVAVAIPAMTTTVMQISGRTYANSAAAALNANRQIGALVGVALVGTILHTVPDWNLRLPLAFAAFALAYGLASLLVYRFVATPQAQIPCAVKTA
ncbi:MFS transporter [Rhodoferax sp.]|uniref:MFS transporter n=1 Tax=Rhodoferax sp. TaxID=50421 RepID=UPI0025D53D9C|nr:MFS transporter [Rhodoferax sp.]